MGDDPVTSVVDKFSRTYDVANVFIRDGSIMPTQSSENPGLTIISLARAHADYPISPRRSHFHPQTCTTRRVARAPSSRRRRGRIMECHG